MASLSDVQQAKAAVKSQFLQLGLGGGVVHRRETLSVSEATMSAGRNVHAVGIGRKLEEGEPTAELCVRLYVVQKLPQTLLSPRDRLPAEIDGVPTDIVQAEPAFLLAKKKKRASRTRAASSTPTCSTNRQQRQRPVIAGISTGHWDITAGTLGCFCRSTRAGDDPSATYVLSNNHVYANVDQALIGDPLYQPGPLDGATFTDHFANLHRVVPIVLGGTTPNRVDAAIGILLGSVSHIAEICSIGEVTGTTEAEEEMLVRKHGRTTGLTHGKIDDIEYDALVGMDHNDPTVEALFEDQLRITSTTSDPFGLGGDSGSAVVHETDSSVVGLYFAGPDDGSYGVANKVQHVLTELEIGIP